VGSGKKENRFYGRLRGVCKSDGKSPSYETLSGIPQDFREFRRNYSETQDVEVSAVKLQLQHIALMSVRKTKFPPALN
jgi:hypothetical protein